MVLVAHAPRESALRWLEKSKVDFPLLVDESSTLYRQFGLRRAIKPLVGLPTSYYAEQRVAGKQLVWPDKKDSTLDMGGDFIVNEKGEVLYCYCQTYVYRRPLSGVLAVLQ